MVWALGSEDGPLELKYPYFETPEPVVEDDPGTYVATETVFSVNTTHSWNHGLGETITALMGAGMELVSLEEHDSVPWEALPGQMTLGEDREWRLSERPERLAASFTLQAVKR